MSRPQIRHGTHWKQTTSKLRATQDMEQQPQPSTDSIDSPTGGHTPTAVDSDADGPVLLSEELLKEAVELSEGLQSILKEQRAIAPEAKETMLKHCLGALMLLLEQELPECHRRQQIDEITEKLCTSHSCSKNSRKI
jgi:hypothetical protein